MRLLLLFFINFYIINAQETLLQGTIELNHHSLENIHIINLSNKKTSISNAEGKFSILANEDDLLVFSAVHIDYWRQSVNNDNINKGKIFVKLNAKTEMLDEVIVEKKPEFNAKDLGIINYTPKVYTQVERKKRAANDGPIEIISSWIKGKNKIFKKELEIEKKIKYQEQLNNLFKKEYFSETLKIPEIYVDGFIFYVVETPELIASLQEKDTLKTKFVLSDLATDFLEYIK
jgi:hypothetical protein